MRDKPSCIVVDAGVKGVAVSCAGILETRRCFLDGPQRRHTRAICRLRSPDIVRTSDLRRLKLSGMPGCSPRPRSGVVDLGLSGRTFGYRLLMLHLRRGLEEQANLKVERPGVEPPPVEVSKEGMQAQDASMHGTAGIDLISSKG